MDSMGQPCATDPIQLTMAAPPRPKSNILSSLPCSTARMGDATSLLRGCTAHSQRRKTRRLHQPDTPRLSRPSTGTILRIYSCKFSPPLLCCRPKIPLCTFMGLISKLKSKLHTKTPDAARVPGSNTSTAVSASPPMSPEERRQLVAAAADRRIAEQRARGGLSQKTVEDLQRRKAAPQPPAVGVSNQVSSDQYREMLT
eukprot:Gregarina_sp_Pseudo_9__1822@NODE_2240_length_1081_cov_57_854127_g2063_i0_p2_GENE_NODE_2240_length_1081_cov_57_854127_g2063_i0NODE_2240_length_1081_cov_57_854127_g2063_i0_p2_ORF_typecomplete_len199_score26_86SVIP/PF15811_5/1_6e04SVIP/PF15811_5/6e06_NODE_2240_length_1081_cov_57_854127_g2063_i04381034